MNQQKNIIVINGKSYDIGSGNIISSQTKQSKTFSDFINAPSVGKPHSKHSAATKRKARHLAHHKPQKSVTLKRAPHNVPEQRSKVNSIPVKSATVVTAIGNNHLTSNQTKFERAKQISKSSSISRFNYGEPLIKRLEPQTVQPAPSKIVSHTPSADNAATTFFKQDESIFSQALVRADSHKQLPPKISRRKHRISQKLHISPKLANALIVSTAVVVLSGFIAYQNAPNISLKLAASRSGLASARLPSYKPSGFSLNRQISASPGQISINFHSNSDDRAFTITQASSNWDSQTLADSYLTGKQAQRIDQTNGKTIYIYDDSSATWVDGGNWYRVEGNSSLTSDQLLKIANSL